MVPGVRTQGLLQSDLGFPGEQADDYLEMGRIVPLITHLQPPVGEGR